MIYNLNKKNINNFIKTSDKEVVKIVKKIIKNTKYISNKYFFNLFKKNIKYLLKIFKKYKNIYVYVFEKNKSNYWLYLYLKKTFNINIKEINFHSNIDKLTQDDYIIFIDDCIYTGNQLGGIIANFMDIFKEKIKNKEQINILVLVSFISIEGKKYIKKTFKYNNIQKKYKLNFVKYIYKLNSSNKILTNNEIELMNKYYPRIKLIDNSQRNYFNDKYFIYFNHKLADGTSTIPLFYKGLVPNTYNLNILSNYIDGDYKKLIIYPLISNCKYSNNFNNDCPKAPYKKA